MAQKVNSASSSPVPEKFLDVSTQDELSCPSTGDPFSDGALSDIVDKSEIEEAIADTASEESMSSYQAESFTETSITAEQEEKPCVESAVKEQLVSDLHGKLSWTMEDTFLCCEGYLPQGDDIFVARMSIAEALATCTQLPDCQGFTFRVQLHDKEPLIHFKSRWELLRTADESWTSIRYVKAMSREAELPADLLVHGALQPTSRVDFPQITEICERLERKPEEVSSTVSSLVGVVQAPGNFNAKLKALTIINEMLYNIKVVEALDVEEGFASTLKLLQDARETGLGVAMDANIRMLATEIDRQLPHQPPGPHGNKLRDNVIKASQLASREFAKTKSKMTSIARAAKSKPEILQDALLGALKVSSDMLNETKALKLKKKAKTRRFPIAVALDMDDVVSDGLIERKRQVPSMKLNVQWERQQRFASL
jgi:hypothetical protein